MTRGVRRRSSCSSARAGSLDVGPGDRPAWAAALAAVPGYTGQLRVRQRRRLMVQPIPEPDRLQPTAVRRGLSRAFPERDQEDGGRLRRLPRPPTTPKDKVLGDLPAYGLRVPRLPRRSTPSQGEADWKPIAQKLKDCGAEVVYFAGSPNPNFENFLDAANQVDYDPIWFSDANFVRRSLAEWNVNGYADNVYCGSSFTPLVEADEDPATQQYIDIVTATAATSTSSARRRPRRSCCGRPRPRRAARTSPATACMDELRQGARAGPVAACTREGNPGENLPGDCGMVLKLKGTEFVRVVPEEPGTFDCDPSYVQPRSPARSRAVEPRRQPDLAAPVGPPRSAPGG